MRYRHLGRTGLVVSELGFGASAIGGAKYGNSYGPTNDATSIAAVRESLEFGCTFFDTADVYGHGHSEELLGRALRAAGKLNEVVIATKVGGNFYDGRPVLDFSAGHILRAIDASLHRLGRDYVDLYQLHNPPVEVIEDGSAFETMQLLKTSGKIRDFGVSVNAVSEGAAVISKRLPATIQLPYNLLSQLDPENGEEKLFAEARQACIGVIAREPLANGFLSGKHKRDTQYGPGDMRAQWPIDERRLRIELVEALRFLEQPGVTLTQAALRFTLDEADITTTIVGIKTPAQVKENFSATRLASFEHLFNRATMRGLITDGQVDRPVFQ
jgi:aryl-alcohol dehydrogenase-like predicted oxidoreductase